MHPQIKQNENRVLDVVEEEVRALKAERDRYKAALERIANWTSGDTSSIVIARDVLGL